jgi:hypothetical protein
MRFGAVLSLLLVLPVLAAHAADEKKAGGTSPGLEQFKQLAGDWVGKSSGLGEGGQEVRANYKVTSGGSAVVETLFPGSEHEMVTVIHRDGDNLVLTHYCMLGNQPHMKAKDDANKIAFKFTGASNMKSDNDMHMHEATFTFIDKDTYKAEWTHYKDGKAAGTVVFEMKRKK